MAPYPRHFRYRCEPAGTIVRALGGVRRCAARLGVSTELCSQWNRPAIRGGTGGYVPERYWEQVLSAASAAGCADRVTRDLLETGKKEKADMGAMSRRKGALFENQIVKELRALGFDARRVPLSGAAVGWPGDVVVRMKSREWILQCKIDGTGAGGRQTVLRALAQVAWCRVSAAGVRLVAMRRDLFVALLRGEAPKGLNVATITVPGQMILQHIDGHDALVFRRSGSSEWMAVVREENVFATIETREGK